MSRRKIGDEEKKLWEQIMGGTKPLKKDKIAPTPQFAHRQVRRLIEENQGRRQEWLSVPVAQDDTPKGLVVNKQVKIEKVVVEARLDLHDMTQDQAWLRLQQFILECYQKHKQWVLVITGKGGPEGMGVIRKNAPSWLNALPLVGAFCFARPQDGGAGAFYVRVKRNLG